MSSIETLIAEIKNDRGEFGLSIPQGLDNKDVDSFRIKFKEYFKTSLDDGYLEFLNICNGLEENGVIIYSSNNFDVNNVLYGIFENNEVWYNQDEENRRYIFFAESGQYTFVFNKTEMNFELLDRYSGDVVEVFDSFNKMLGHILKLMLT